MRLALVAIPARRASYTPTLAAYVAPRSSQLTMTRLSEAPYPSRSASVLTVADGTRCLAASARRVDASAQLAHGLVDVDVPGRQGLQHIARGRSRFGRSPVQPQPLQEGVEAGAGGWIAHTEVALEVLHVAPGGEEDAQHGAVLDRERAVLARGEVPGQLGAAGVTPQAGEGQAFSAHGAVARGVAGGGHGPAATR